MSRTIFALEPPVSHIQLGQAAGPHSGTEKSTLNSQKWSALTSRFMTLSRRLLSDPVVGVTAREWQYLFGSRLESRILGQCRRSPADVEGAALSRTPDVLEKSERRQGTGKIGRWENVGFEPSDAESNRGRSAFAAPTDLPSETFDSPSSDR